MAPKYFEHPNIFVSSSCVHCPYISESVACLAEAGFKNIELSGGTDYYDGLEKDLVTLKNKYNLTFAIHNYFPPPKQHFVLNLASPDEHTRASTLIHIKNAVRVCRLLNCQQYGVHAGFFLDPQVNSLGNTLDGGITPNKEQWIDRFCEAFSRIMSLYSDIDFYLENNVISKANFVKYQGNVFMLTNHEEYADLCKRIKFRLLLDVAHLKVSCETLGIDFTSQLNTLSSESNYIHLSDNDGLSDSNRMISAGSILHNQLMNINLKGKRITLEIYESIASVKRTYELVAQLC